MKRPQINAAFVLAAIALFVSLSGTAWAATGGSFILGTANTANAKSSLAAAIPNPALTVTNTKTAASSTALALKVAPGNAPMSVNSAGEVANLNADFLDGFDASAFVRGNAVTSSLAVAPAAGGELGGVTAARGIEVTFRCPANPLTAQGSLFVSQITGSTINIFVSGDIAGGTNYAQTPTNAGRAFGVGPGAAVVTVQAQGAFGIEIIHIAYAGRATDCHGQFESTLWQ